VATALDQSCYRTLAKAAKFYGIPRPLMGTMVAQGIIPSMVVPGHLPVVRLDDVERAIRMMEVPATHPRVQAVG
jgi:hypothetical protein